MNAAPISISDVCKSFPGDVVALDHVSLEIFPGELFFLLGPSGCGKTTLLRSIAGFVEPDSGQIRLDKKDITKEPPHKRNTGMVFQNYALWPHLTIRQNVAFGLEMRKMTKTQISQATTEALQRVQMLHKADARPNELSGGQQQRIALARALVVEPRCLLLDEPLSNLDAKLRLEMRQEIRRICKATGITAIYVTHDQKEALSIADRMAVLADGKVQQVGTPQEIYRTPATSFVAEFIGESNFIRGSVIQSKNDMVEIKTDVGLFMANAQASLSPGSDIILSIRPECVLKANPPLEKRPNVFTAQCKGVVYQGESVQYLLHAGGTDWKRHEWNPQILDNTGQEEWLYVDPHDIVILQS
jgi:iron(III) transport system ATP-binding protein